MQPALITALELKPLTHVRIVDASWHMPASGRDARAEYASEHIPGAMFFDLDAVSDKKSPYPHMLPDEKAFAVAMGELGIDEHVPVVVYDSLGLFSAARLWWMLRVFGHKDVRVLDGGLPEWKKRGGEVESKVTKPEARRFFSEYDGSLVASLKDMQKWTRNDAVQIADARGAGRFSGKEPEPRAGVKSGHIPGSRNVHYASLLTKEGKLKPKSQLRKLFDHAGITLGERIVATCGSGVTACILALALYEIGYPDVPVYDGSWAEWGSLDLQVEVGK